MKTGRLLLVTVVLLSSVPYLYASQVPAHVYVALNALAAADQSVRDVINSDAAVLAYLAGSSGPDVANTTFYVQLAAGMDQPGYESHKLRTGELTCNLLRLAQGNVQQAYALGWLTHWELDLHVHPLVNKYGGVYHVDPTWHKHLEQVECEHVFNKVGKTVTDNYVPQASACPAALINAAFAATFPTGGNSAAYQPSQVQNYDSGVMVTVPPTFAMNLPSGADNMQIVSQSWVDLHNTGTYSGAWATVENKLATKGPPPTPEEYKVLMDPLRIDDVQIQHSTTFGAASRLRIEYTVNDARLIKPFCEDWDKVVKAAVPQVTALMNSWAANPAGFALEDADLDNGRSGYDPDNPALAWPGHPDIREMLVFLNLKDNNGRPLRALDPATGNDWDPTGVWVPLAPLQQGGLLGLLSPAGLISTFPVWKGTGGRGYFEVLLDPQEQPPTQIEVTGKLADKKDKQFYGVEATWTQQKKPELSILFLVDCSGSMDGEKLEAAKAAVINAVTQTNDGKTEWALARYGSCGVSVVCRFTMDPSQLSQGCAGLGAGGDTPLTYGRNLAMSYLVRKGQGRQGRLILLCDGQDNCTEHGSASQPEAAASLLKLMQTVDQARMSSGGSGGTP